jgi:phosphatidylglycerophosphate synthase
MTSTQPDLALRARRWTLVRATPGVAGALLRAAILGGLAIAGVGLALPGASPVATIAALVFFCAASGVAVRLLPRHYPHDRLGLGNRVTLARLVLVSVLVSALLSGPGPSWSFCAVAAFALLLDGVDGWLARRQRLVSVFGARFDMEVDSLLALVLALNAALGTGAGLAALVLGLPRYLFLVAALALPWLRRPLPERFSRKLVCVVQLGVLIALQAPILPPMAGTALGLIAAAALTWSFATDILWLWRRRA